MAQKNKIGERMEKLMEKYGSMIDEELESAMPKKGGMYHPYLNEPIWYHMDTGGKRFRPALCLVATELLGGDVKKAIHFAAATEIIHNFLLIHDDVMDGDRMRRDKPTIWVKYGIPNAINVGDYMMFKAYEEILKTDMPIEKVNKLMAILTKTLVKTGEGQALDLNFRAKPDFTEKNYLELARLKTGYYLIFGVMAAGVISGMDDENIERLWDLGANMGTAFQIKDDIIDMTVGKGRGGALGNDIKEGKPSFLYAAALKQFNAEDKKRLIEIMQKEREETRDDEVSWVINKYKSYGILDYAQSYADKLVKDAYKIVDSMPFEKKDVLRDIVKYMAERNK